MAPRPPPVLCAIHAVCGLFTEMRACPQNIIAKFDSRGAPNRKIDMDELREILTDMDEKKRPPIPKNLL